MGLANRCVVGQCPDTMLTTAGHIFKQGSTATLMAQGHIAGSSQGLTTSSHTGPTLLSKVCKSEAVDVLCAWQ